MGAGSSFPNNVKSHEPPPLPPPFFTGNPQSGISRISGTSCDSQGDRCVGGHGSQGNSSFQNPRSSESIKNEEWWHHRPSAPSLTSLRRQQETLLTYAAQMTGWQSGCESAVPSMHQEAMELSRTVSHLAAANQQLASAHTILLAQLEALYLELNRERELRLERESEDNKTTRNNGTSLDDNDREKLTDRIANLEATINDKSNNRDRKLRNFHEESGKSLSRKDVGIQSENVHDELQIRLGSSTFETNSCASFLKSLKNDEDNKNEEENDLSIEYKKAVDRIECLENELAISHTNFDSTFEKNDNTRSKRKNGNKIFLQENENINGKRSCERNDFNCEKDLKKLLEEVERLKNDKLVYKEKNKKLLDDLEKRAMIMATLRRDCEVSRSQYEKVVSNLNERKLELDALILDYENAKSEKLSLLTELRKFNFDIDAANVRIADLEKELANSNRENERVSKIEDHESSRLKKMLSVEIHGRKEQEKSLEEAHKEIQRLNEIIKNVGKNEEAREEIEMTENEEDVSNLEEEETLEPEVTMARSSNMEEFRKELSLKREARQRAIAAVSSEMDRLRRELDAEKEAHSETSRVLDLLKSGQSKNPMKSSDEDVNKDSESDTNERLEDKKDWKTIMKPDPELNSNEADAQALTDILKVSDELKSSIRLQTEKIDDLRYHLECEPEGHKNRIASLKEIARKSREISGTRERQMNKLKNLLAQILARIGDPRFRVEISDDVRAEHDRQLEDIRRLKCLYDDRLRILADLRESASKELIDLKEKLKSSRKENCGLEEDLKKAEEKIDIQDTEISNLESQLGLTKADCRDLQNQMSVINGLFTQMLLSASSADMDLDRLTRLLQENHDLITDMAREEGTEAAALPKLLLDIVEQVEGRNGNRSGDGETDRKEDDLQEENIAHNLPKVWRVLLELLSCHAAGSPPATPASLSTDPNSCYKSVDTPSGPRLVISVSKTYIRLKELILEKKHLEKEMNRMKTLNTHLESKLGEQEKRLSTVSSELSKTWNIVGRMQAQHQQLHTHEKILRYELQQKRKMLQELKQELEYCREKWESARQKNTNTEIEWRSLRREFAARKSLAAQDSFNNSGESGFSDERGDDSDEEDEAVGERMRLGPRRRARKENPRAPTPDTESEQPTDTELSETKTTPETNVSTEDVSIASMSANSSDKFINEETELLDESECSGESKVDGEEEKSMNPLDEALTNVIENLITGDESNVNESAVSIASVEKEDTDEISKASSNHAEVEEPVTSRNKDANDSGTEVTTLEDSADSNKSSKVDVKNDVTIEETEVLSASTVSVFSIGPFPNSSTSSSTKSVQFSDPLVVGPSIQLALPILDAEVPGSLNSLENTRIEENMITSKSLTKEDERGEEMKKEEDENLIDDSSSSNSAEASKICLPELPEVLSSLPEATPSTSSGSTSLDTSLKPVRSHEEVLAARAARLKRLEEQADWLMKKMNATSRRGSALSTRLEELHEVYGEAPVPPPMPDVLPNVRIPSVMRHRQIKEETSEKGSDASPSPDSS